jgi:hypothetical protein
VFTVGSFECQLDRAPASCRAQLLRAPVDRSATASRAGGGSRRCPRTGASAPRAPAGSRVHWSTALWGRRRSAQAVRSSRKGERGSSKIWWDINAQLRSTGAAADRMRGSEAFAVACATSGSSSDRGLGDLVEVIAELSDLSGRDGVSERALEARVGPLSCPANFPEPRASQHSIAAQGVDDVLDFRLLPTVRPARRSVCGPRRAFSGIGRDDKVRFAHGSPASP